MLDLVISDENEDFIRNATITDIISDHATVDIKLAINKPGLPKKKITYRKYRAIAIIQLLTEILASDLVVISHSTLENLVKQNSIDLTNLIGKHAPLRSKVFTERPLTPW